ncbi:domain-containing protein [Lentinula edodes]|uniref:Domain-containing protein n=1 Tax=Lentinula edodes TaxID=5353 RepID=A0A1Q3EB47_LENED|nr:domain-containing protein [Lentinula edodes]
MAAPSGITYKAKRSNREVLRERLQNNSALREHFESNRDVHHYKKLTRPTIHNHENIKGHYRDFAAYTQECFEEGRSKKLPQPSEIVIGTPLPPLEYVKDFVCYLASALQGRDASTFIRLETLRGYMFTFLALWPRYANVHPTPEMRYQVRSYLLSEELQAAVKLSTKIRTLKHIEPQCLQIIMETLHSSTNIFRSNRTRLQMAFLILFSAASAARPGSVVESACYRGSNEALTWGDIDFYLIPDDEDPAHPSLVVDIQLNLVKGYRNVDHRYQKLLFTLELRKEHCMTCIALPLLGLAFHDSVFTHFHSIESLLCPEKPPTTRVKILLRNEVLTLPVLRKEEKGGGGKVSRTDAFHYDGLNRCLKLLSIAAGFPESITLYDFHVSQGNKADVDLGETARKTLMLHDPNSKVYFAIIAASSGRDTNAPQHLSLEERAKLLNEPELVKLQNEKDEATNKIQQLLANEQSEEVEKQIIELRQIAAKASNGHRFLYLRESCLHIKQARQEFFDNAAVRQMLNPVRNPQYLTYNHY